MNNRLPVIMLVIVILLSIYGSAFACNETQTNTYVMQIIFGYNAASRQSENSTRILLNALYTCSEQSDGLGQDKYNYLNEQGVSGIPSFSEIDIKGNRLLECTHIRWEDEYTGNRRIRIGRKTILRNAVNKVFDFGFLDNIFGSTGGKCDSFAAILYYSHILADYLADDPSVTETDISGLHVSAYSGQPYSVLNGNKPLFATSQMNSNTFASFSSLDYLGRAGVAFANIGIETLPPSNSRQEIGMIRPSGWKQNYMGYPGMINSSPPYLYNRCHLIAHQLAGEDGEINLITGTRYLNETGMKPFEDFVRDYIQATHNHVLYRATPHYKGENKVASGVQLEALSVEDNGQGVCFNVYCYNVQPGIQINYMNGDNEICDVTYNNNTILPFAVENPSDTNPDLIYEMSKHFSVIFSEQKESSLYKIFMGTIDSVASEARAIGRQGENQAQQYMKQKTIEYQYFEVLKNYVPLLLQNESFFQSAYY